MQKSRDKTFIIVSQDYSGLGFADMCQKEGYETLMAIRAKDDLKKEDVESFDQVGVGIIQKVDLDQIMKARKQFKDAYWIWDGNHNPEDSETLRSEGFKVFGGSELMNKMEHDRNFGASLVKAAGLPTPETYDFKTLEEGLKFLEEPDNKETAFVFKPDEGEGAYSTYVPNSKKDADAHDELECYMRSLSEDGITYILQERKKGVEANFEIWVYKGQPFFGFCSLECKRRSAQDQGEMVGCAFDLNFCLPLEAKAFQETCMRLLPQMPKDYTGFLDMNVIVADKKNYFLEFCARFGYNAHPNLFLNLAIDSFPDIIAAFIDGDIEDFYDHFRDGFGASILCRIDHPKKGFPVYMRDGVEKHVFLFDEYKEEEQYFLSGFGNEALIVTGHDYTPKTAGEEAITNYAKINFPMKDGRLDMDKNDFPTAPIARFDALNAMGYLDVEK